MIAITTRSSIKVNFLIPFLIPFLHFCFIVISSLLCIIIENSFRAKR